MSSILKSLRVLADPNRLRLLRLLEQEELSVAELQEILALGQSTISTHLSQLKRAALVEDRRIGKNSLYRFTRQSSALTSLIAEAAAELPETSADQVALKLVLRKRKDKSRAFFDEMAGRFGREYVPGRSWQAVSEMLFKLMPPLIIADLGAGEGTLSLLLAQQAKKVIAVDNSERMVDYGQTLAERQGMKSIEYRRGDLEDVPIESATIDLAIFSQSLHHAIHPEQAVAEAWRILKPEGRVAILDLGKHRFEEARELYADLWLGFSEVELDSLLQNAGFCGIQTALVHKETEAPYFQTLLAVGNKPYLSQ